MPQPLQSLPTQDKSFFFTNLSSQLFRMILNEVLHPMFLTQVMKVLYMCTISLHEQNCVSFPKHQWHTKFQNVPPLLISQIEIQFLASKYYIPNTALSFKKTNDHSNRS